MAILKDNVGLSAEDVKKIKAMRPSMSVDIQYQTATTAKRVKTEFIGMDFRRCVILKFPDESKWGNVRDGLYQDSNVIVRYILEDETGEVIAFKSKISFILSKPQQLLFLTFPTAIQNMGLRAEQRKQLRIPTKVASSDLPKVLDAIMLDLSSGGSRIGFSRKLPLNNKFVGTNFTLDVKGPNQQSATIEAEVKNYKLEDSLHCYGLKFVESSDVIEQILIDLDIDV
jgi:hypothetical protein